MRTAAAAALALALATGGSSGAEDGPPRPGMVLVFSDTFDGDDLGTRWSWPYPDGRRSQDGESQVYLDPGTSGSGVTVSNGTLRLSARPMDPDEVASWPGKGHVSGLVTTAGRFSFTYGYVEARVRIPAAQGLWPAFWLFREDGFSGDGPYGEIDVMEILAGEPGKTYSTIHAGERHEGRKIRQAVETRDPPYSDGFVTYAVDWGEDSVAFYVDGRETGRFPTDDAVKAPMVILLNLAVGGPWGGMPDGTTPWPAVMEVDWVRVWRRP